MNARNLCIFNSDGVFGNDNLPGMLTQKLSPTSPTSATPTTHLELERNRCSLQREVSKLTPVPTMAGMVSHFTIRAERMT